MKKPGNQSTTAGHVYMASRNLTLLDPNSIKDQNVYSRIGQRLDPNGYCSSQGYKVEESHTSATCCFPSNGHNKSATRLDIKRGKTWNKEWIKGGPTKWGEAGLDKNIVDSNENYINYIQSNPKLIEPMDGLAVTDTRMMGNYLTLDSPCNNKKHTVHPLPIQIQNG